MWAEQGCRLSAVLHAAIYGPEAGQHEVEESTSQHAVEIAEWFAAEQLAVLQSGRSHGIAQTLTAIWRVATISSDGFTARQLQRKHVVDDAEQANSALGLMVEKGVLTAEKMQTGGKPTTVFKLTRLDSARSSR